MAAFTFFVAMSGAFVAGNDAGLIYNTYPMMADRWFPSDYFHPYMNPIQNLFENGTAVQFNHRYEYKNHTISSLPDKKTDDFVIQKDCSLMYWHLECSHHG